jgi:hypothetical protein
MLILNHVKVNVNPSEKMDFDVRQNMARCVLSILKTVLRHLKPLAPTSEVGGG